MTSTVPVWIDDPVNAAILAVSEDRLQGFQLDPFGEIAERSGVDVATVLERIVAMLRAGTIRRVRQTLMATNLARRRAVRVAGAGGAARRRVRLAVPRGSVLGPRRDPHDRRRDAGLELPAVDDAQGAAGLLAREARGVLGAHDRRRALPADAGEGAVRARASATCGAAASSPARAPTCRPR